MKIQKVEKLNHARFNNFNWPTALDPFCNGVNLFFGWNGSGKTTFSKIIRGLEMGKIQQGCSFKIKTDSAQISESDDLSSITGNIKVFNENYIEEILRGSPTIPYIFFAGKEAVDYAEDEKNSKIKKQNYLNLVYRQNRMTYQELPVF